MVIPDWVVTQTPNNLETYVEYMWYPSLKLYGDWLSQLKGSQGKILFGSSAIAIQLETLNVKVGFNGVGIITPSLLQVMRNSYTLPVLK